MKRKKREYTAVDAENIMEVVDSEAMDSIVKLLDKRVEDIGMDILNRNLQGKGSVSFADLGISQAKYQGAKDLLQYLKNNIKELKRRSIQGE